MVKYRLTKRGKIIIVLLCFLMLLSVPLGVSLSKEKPIGNDMGSLKPEENQPIIVPEPPAQEQPKQGQADTAVKPTDELKARIFFDANSTSFNSKYDKDLELIITAAKQYESARIQIEGNCATLFDDNKSKGQKSTNYNLSLIRAERVAKYLKDKGISADRLVVVANGSDKPIKDNNTPAGREYNRRVDVFFLSK